MSRYDLEVLLTWIAVGSYIVGAVLQIGAVLFAWRRGRRWGLAVAGAGLVPHGAAIVVRWIAVGHGPYMARSEVLSSNAWVAVAVLTVVVATRPSWSALSIPALPLAILTVAVAQFANPESRELPPTLRSIWLVFHIIFAKISAAAFLVALGAAVLLLLADRSWKPAWLMRAPPPPALDALLVRAAGFGFIFWTITIAAGAIWGNQSWGRYWGWDPIETWALVSWLTWGAFLHARLFFKLGPRPTAWLTVGSFAVFILTMLILPVFLRSLHSSYFS